MPYTCSFVQHHFGNESARINWMWLIQATHVASNGTGKVFMQLCCVGPSYPYYHLIQRCLSCVFEVAVVSLSLYVPQLLGMLCQLLRTDSVPRCQEWLSDASADRKTHYSSIIYYTSFDFGGFASFQIFTLRPPVTMECPHHVLVTCHYARCKGDGTQYTCGVAMRNRALCFTTDSFF